jgi:hypothetical protein
MVVRSPRMTPEQIARATRWIATWKLERVDLERIRRKKLRSLDIYEAISRLCKSADYTLPPPKPWSGLVELQEWFKKAAERERNR